MNRLPIIQRCEERDCFYNHDQGCHAPAINVGSSHPRCDTYTTSGSHTKRGPVGLVGACQVAGCVWNDELTCGAPHIVVGPHNDHPDCLTFQEKT